MHELFAQVLNDRDLSRAGDLFSISDETIVEDLSNVLSKIQEIASASDFIKNDNDQSVVEITITRVTSAIRETGTIEQHGPALVSLLESCLNHDLRPSPKDEDPPHAKITSDLVSCIFLNHNRKCIMKLALPIAVKFLHRGNKELSRNLSSYLSLAAINNAELLAPHIQPIIDSIIGGNYSLARVLPQIYAVNKHPIHDHVMALVSLLPQCEEPEKLSLLALFSLIAKHKPSLLESNVPQLSECLLLPSTVASALQIFLDMASVRPQLFTEHVRKIKSAAELQPSTLPHVARLLALIGKLSLERGRECLQFLVSQLSKADHSSLHGLLKELRIIAITYPALLSEFYPKVAAQLESSQSSTARMCLQQLKSDMAANKMITMTSTVNQTKGGVTIVKLCGSRTNLSSSDTPSHHITPVQKQPQQRVSSPVSSSLSSPPYLSSSRPPNVRDSQSNLSSSRHRLAALPDTRSLTQLSSLPVVNKSMSRLPTSSGLPVTSHQNVSRLGSPSSSTGMHHTSMTRLNVNRSLTAISSTGGGSRHHTGTSAARIFSGGVTISTMPSHKSIAVHSSGSMMALQEEPCQLSSPSVVMVSINGSSAGGPSSPSTASTAPLSEPSNLTRPNHSASLTTTGSSQTSSLPPSFPSTQEMSQAGSPTMNNNNNNIIGNGVVASPQPRLRNLNNNNSTRVNMNATGEGMSNTHRISVFEPYPMRDAIQHFCEKHLDKIKAYMQKVFVKIPLPVKCTIEERKSKKHAKLHFVCQGKGVHCLYNKSLFMMKTRNPRVWIHLMFLALQARAASALSTRETSVSSLKNCWDTLKADNKTFLTLVTSAFPSAKDQDSLILELRNSRFFDVFEYNAPITIWGCFLCNHPDRAQGFLQANAPVIEGQLKEKKGKWKLFKRWRTRYFTLSGAHLSYRGTKDEGGEEAQPIEVSQIRSVRAISSRGRNIPKAFEIFTNDKTFVLKAKDSKNTEQWVQYLSIAMAHSHAKEVFAH